MTSAFTDASRLFGHVTIEKVFLDGSREVAYSGDNLITTSGKLAALNQLAYSIGSGDPLKIAKVGTGGAIDPEGLFLKEPTVDMVDLYTPVATAPIVKIAEDAGVPSITLMATVDNLVGNGLTLNEAGFFTASGSMFNIKTFAGVPKDSTFALNITWVIKFK